MVISKSALRTDLPTSRTSVSLQQTNTSDMLDLAVDYIKDLQKEVKVRVCHLEYHST
jgi:hypothetical protein